MVDFVFVSDQRQYVLHTAMLSTDRLMVSRTRWQGGLLDSRRKPKWVKREVLDLPRDARVMREAVKVKEYAF